MPEGPLRRDDMRSLVTGSSGFLGRHLVERLQHDGEVALFEKDVRDPTAFAGLPPADVVYHLAAKVSVAGSIADPADTWRVNVDGTLNLLDWVRRQPNGTNTRIVLVSSAHVYGRAAYSPIDEEHPLRPVSPYGASKLAAEALGLAYGQTYGLDVVVIRPFNVYGPGQKVGSLIPDILHQIREGKELRLGDTRPIRDFTFATDAVDLLCRAGTTAGVSNEVFNLGSGVGHSVAQIAEMSLGVSGSHLKPVTDPARFRAVETLELVVDSTKARERFGWAPQVALEEGLLRTWAATAGAHA